jgi:two-component system, chemotaxis family, chemotaxis protein CheY
LVVDDSETMQRIVCKLLHSIGFENLECARSGMEALQKLHEKPFGLVISDWYMERMTGLMLTERIRADPVLKDIPVILISAVAKADNVIAAKDAGANAYVVKPFSAEALKLKIGAALSSVS